MKFSYYPMTMHHGQCGQLEFVYLHLEHNILCKMILYHFLCLLKAKCRIYVAQGSLCSLAKCLSYLIHMF